MPQFYLTPAAMQDLNDIENYIALDNPEAAQRLILVLREKCSFLAKRPKLAAPYKKFGNLRKHAIGSYLIFYRPVKNAIEIVRIMHGARDLQKIVETIQ